MNIYRSYIAWRNARRTIEELNHLPSDQLVDLGIDPLTGVLGIPVRSFGRATSKQ
ncbi:DUF1127 domain-containing protein (plasmid) [Phyllobacterium sp. 628]|uniref:DUF1127 domain-containing protein n=1 Tax=Phyllobacterium sp. 628 TaxID=2718938 RepID=UPI0016623F19|nr:DUF1127 domain-containing protein [Phyllobacterium sp. 628]QND50489.1 DUF1127 domain-containing protein [Phyllobacterium sp. 628]